jgi:transcriptional regulator
MYKLKSATVPITQDSMAGVLGTRRASISIAAKSLHESGAIRYARGTVTIVDRNALLDRSCSCFEECRLALAELE